MSRRLGALAGITAIGLSAFVPVTAFALPAGAESIVINEVVSTNGEPGDWVEFYNSGDQPVDLSGYIFEDSDGAEKPDHRYPLPEGSVIEPGGYLVLDELSKDGV